MFKVQGARSRYRAQSTAAEANHQPVVSARQTPGAWNSYSYPANKADLLIRRSLIRNARDDPQQVRFATNV